MTEKLSGYTIIILLAGSILTFIMLFIFAKRQIMRFALRNRRGPHVAVGQDARKSLKRELERRLDLIPKIQCEPRLININDSRYILMPGQKPPVNYNRLKAVDDVKLLEKEITRQDPYLRRQTHENLRAYLLTTLAAPLNGSGQRLIHQFCDLYEHARHDPSEFSDDDYHAFSRLLFKLFDAAKLLKSFNRSKNRNHTPMKSKGTDKNRGVLDPTRLRPPSSLNSTTGSLRKISSLSEVRTDEEILTTTSDSNLVIETHAPPRPPPPTLLTTTAASPENTETTV